MPAASPTRSAFANNRSGRERIRDQFFAVHHNWPKTAKTIGEISPAVHNLGHNFGHNSSAALRHRKGSAIGLLDVIAVGITGSAEDPYSGTDLKLEELSRSLDPSIMVVWFCETIWPERLEDPLLEEGSLGYPNGFPHLPCRISA